MSEELQAKANRCFSLEDDGKALDCLKGIVRDMRQDGAVCQPKLVILSQKGCPYCVKEQTRHQEDIAAGVMEIMDVHSPEGVKVVGQNGIESVPAILLLDCQNNLIEPES